jgi:preprotein translocase subunit SecE
VARNRKRAKERRTRRPQAVSARTREQADEPLGPPNPLDHAAPDAEIAEAAEIPAELRAGGAFEEDAYDVDGEAFEEEAEDALEPSDVGQGPPGGGDVPPEAGDDELAGAPVPAHGARVGRPRNRLLTFVQGSWRELQRVQWPDRRQVMQATGVVIGFVIVAGVFLGVSDWVAGKLVNFVINGSF